MDRKPKFIALEATLTNGLNRKGFPKTLNGFAFYGNSRPRNERQPSAAKAPIQLRQLQHS
jgi:hypothetical protein